MYITEYKDKQIIFERSKNFSTIFELLDKFRVEGKRIRDIWDDKIDEHQDLALLKVTDETYQAKLKRIRVAKERVRTGATCYSVGNMSNQGISISKGIISSESISIIIDNEARKYIQAQISIALGSSGGALLDSRGKLIGITTLRLKDRYGNPQYGYGYSIPISVVLDFLSG